MIDKATLINDFITEAKERLNTIYNDAGSIRTLIQNEDAVEDGLLIDVLRELHTIKGTSRMLGFFNVEKLVHGLEDVLKGVSEKRYEITERIVDLIIISTDACFIILENIKETKEDNFDISSFLSVFECAVNGETINTTILATEIANSSKKKNMLNELENEESSQTLGEIQSIRVKLSRIETIIRSLDSLVIREFRLKHVLQMLKDEEEKTGNRAISLIRKQLSDDITQTETAVLDVQRKIFDLRMLPLEIILQPLKLTVERDSLVLGKKIRLDLPKEEIVLDKLILEQLSDILLHLFRNSLDHGIELPEDRLAAGKDEIGTISVTAKTESNYVEMVITDDGAGIDNEKIRSKALKLYPERMEEINSMTENDLKGFLFIPGFSTLKKVTELSGRGIGLDVVRSDMEKIKGKINFTSEKGKGTSFTLVFPLSLATLQGVFIRTGGMKLLIPAHYVAEITTCRQEECISLQNQKVLMLRDQLIPVYSLSSILGIAKQKKIQTSEDAMLVLEYLGKKSGIIVDEVLRYVSLVVKPLPPILKDLKALQGIVFDENYAIVPILHIPEIIVRFKRLVSYDIMKFDSETRKKERFILVVDDSYTTREIEQTILSLEGYNVDTAVDGIDALNKIKRKIYDVIITDIKMPRMDGYVFVNNLKRQKEFANIPIVVVSSVYDEVVKKEFLSSGVQSFIIKSDFERGNLVSVVKELLHE